MTEQLKRRSMGVDLTEGPILRSLLKFAIPIVLTNLVQQLYSMVDLMVIGWYVGTEGTVGVNAGGEIADIMTPVAICFATAGQIYIAQLFGAGNERQVKRTVGTLLGFILMASLAVMLGIIVFCRPLLHLINCPAEAMGQASQYMIITALGLPFIFCYNAIVGILRGIGESKKPLIFVLVAATVNIFLDLLLVAVIPLEAAGTAIATVMSQVGACTAAAIYLWKNRRKFDFELKWSYFSLDRKILWTLFKLGLPQVMGVLLVRSSVIWINAQINAYGLVVSATNSVGMKLQKFMELFVHGVNSATAAMTGQCLGAGKPERAAKVTKSALGVCLVCAAVSCTVCLLFPKVIYGFFTKDPEVLDMGVVFLRVMLAHVIMSSILGPFQGLSTGCGDVNYNFIIGLLDGMASKILLSLLFVHVFHLGYIGLFMGNSCSRIVSVSIYMVYYHSGRWRRRKLLTEA